MKQKIKTFLANIGFILFVLPIVFLAVPVAKSIASVFDYIYDKIDDFVIWCVDNV